jgi:hypothetical protein
MFVANDIETIQPKPFPFGFFPTNTFPIFVKWDALCQTQETTVHWTIAITDGPSISDPQI